MNVLVINCRSSSLKYQLINMDDESVIAKGNYEKIGSKDSFLTHKVNGQKLKFEKKAKDHTQAIELILEKLVDKEIGVIDNVEQIDIVGHRIVHGGEKFKDSVIIDDDVIEAIKEVSHLAPLHNPAGLQGIFALKKVLPNVLNTATFDTAFHQTIPEFRYMYPIDNIYYKDYGIRKYGFHGTSHKYVANTIANILGKDIKDLKIVNAHIGQGASICTIENGKSVETSMGFTPVSGVAMGTRSGDLDPSVVTYIMEKENLTPKQMDEILNKKSGLLGMSEVSSDNRDIEMAADKNDENAKRALDTYHYLIASQIAKSIIASKGADVLTFTAGVGERRPEERIVICEYLKPFGIEIDEEKNNQTRAKVGKISTDDSKIEVWVVPTNEEIEIARQAVELKKLNETKQ